MSSFTFGDRPLLVLFRGAGGLLGSSSSSSGSGIDTLNARLRERFSEYYLVSQVFNSYEGNVTNFDEVGSSQGRQFLAQFDDTSTLGFVGYSAGGISAIRLAKSQVPKNINLLVQIDSFDPLTGSSDEDEVLPRNVVKGLNYYQNANRLNFFEPDFDPFDLQGARNVAGSQNIDAENFVNDDSLTHRTIDDSRRLQNEILADIEEFVLQDLEFDPSRQLTLTGGAQLFNNVLGLTTGGDQSIGQALITTPIALTPDFSFSSRFEFRLAPAGAAEPLSGFSFWVEPTPTEQGNGIPAGLAIAFNPNALSTPLLPDNAIAVLRPDISNPLEVAIAPLELDSGNPITAWVDYNGQTDQLAVFVDDSLTRPTAPLLTTQVDLLAIAGSTAQVGFRGAIGDTPHEADILTWHLNTNANDLVPPTVAPQTYLNLGLTQRAASAFLGIEVPANPFEIEGIAFADLFDEAYYLRFNPDVLNAVVAGDYTTGYEHFTQFGWLEGRNPSSLYDDAFYRANNPDVAQAVEAGGLASGFEHFIRFGHVEGRDPSASFDQSVYLLTNLDVAAAVSQNSLGSAFEHYIEYGAAEGRDPQLLLFQEGYYLTQNPDVAAAVEAGAFDDGFDHYLSFGCQEKRNPSPLFDGAQYLAQNPDVAAAVEAGEIACGWSHYWLNGRFEGRVLPVGG